MEIAVIEIKEKNIKAIKRYLRKWRVRRNGGATPLEIAQGCKLSTPTVQATLDWLFRDGEVIKTTKCNCRDIFYL